MKMNCLAISIIVFITSLGLNAQDAASYKEVIHWNYSVKKTADKTYEIHLTATIEDSWHIYSQFTPKEGPSLPTKIRFNKNPLITLSGKIKEVGALVTKHEEILDVDLKYFKNKVDFVQTIKLKNNIKTNISGSIEFMACTDERCLMPETISFSVKLE
jgi:hypothetical protein